MMTAQSRSLLLAWLVVLAAALAPPGKGVANEPLIARERADATALVELRREREALIDGYRRDGAFRSDTAATLADRLEALARRSEGGVRAMALFELATIRRITGRFREAIALYDEAAGLAQPHGEIQTAFDSRMGVARSHAYGTRDHGAAADAFAAAVAIAGDAPSRAQGYAMADYASQLLASRGELEAALLSALDARRLAADDGDRFYASLAVGDALQRLAQSCDHRKLVDALTGSDADDADGFGACRRAVRAAQDAYGAARDAARTLGWRHLAGEAQGFLDRIAMRLFLIDQQALFQQVATSGVFSATDAADVLATEDFAAGASELDDAATLGMLIESVVGAGDGEDARSLYLLGLRADLDGAAAQALAYFERAASRLEEERTSLFDLRGRGAVVENRPELVRDLALRLLAMGRPAEAFAAFESIRARGLVDLAGALVDADPSDAERRWLARLADLDSRESALMTGLVETAIAGVEHRRAAEMSARLDEVRRARRGHLGDPAFVGALQRLRQAPPVQGDLATLREAVNASGVTVLLYWVTPASVVVWAVAPDGMEIKSVFLPEAALTEKIDSLLASVHSPEAAFDVRAAQELHAYLVQPFRRHFAAGRVMIVPQGPLVTLPFEALVDARSGRFLIEDLVVSYAANATFAQQALATQTPRFDRIVALFDDDIERQTGEIEGVAARAGVAVEQRRSQDLAPEAALAALDRSPAVHVLLHGVFDTFDPLQSAVSLNRPGAAPADNRLTAADLLAVDWRRTALAVFSACEGARLNRRISNEVYGLSWPLFAGGADAVLMSRWRVEARSNAAWMAAFYAALAAGDASPAEAAAVAMRGFISAGERHPYAWAGPQSFGK